MLSQKDSPTLSGIFEMIFESRAYQYGGELTLLYKEKSILNFFNNFALHPVFVWKVFGTQELYLLFAISKTDIVSFLFV